MQGELQHIKSTAGAKSQYVVIQKNVFYMEKENKIMNI